jgi:two-component system response regulator FixJ
MNLSKRERMVVELLCVGHKDKDIAKSLGIAPRTVQHHALMAQAKLGARTRFQAGFICGSKR